MQHDGGFPRRLPAGLPVDLVAVAHVEQPVVVRLNVGIHGLQLDHLAGDEVTEAGLTGAARGGRLRYAAGAEGSGTTASISIRAPAAKAVTPIVVRAGKPPPNHAV